MRRLQLGIKRAIDIVVSVVGMIVLSPVLLLFAGLVLFGSPGPIFIRQKRVGRHGRIFTMYKFRTMHVGASQTYPGHDDVTWFGRWTRRFGLDEMPQMWNVLKGDMSLVGATRPLRPNEHYVHFADAAEEVLSMRPSWLSLYSLRVRLKTSVHTGFVGEPRFEYDQVAVDLALGYIRGWHLGRDLVVVLQTAAVTLQLLRHAIGRRLRRLIGRH